MHRSTVWPVLVACAALAACGGKSRPAHVVANTSNAQPPATASALPPEPWFHDKAEAFEECVAPPATAAVALPAPYDRCDGAAESWSSPPGGNELHFHYREFSAAVTTARRAQTPGVCCYLVWEFPHYEQ